MASGEYHISEDYTHMSNSNCEYADYRDINENKGIANDMYNNLQDIGTDLERDRQRIGETEDLNALREPEIANNCDPPNTFSINLPEGYTSNIDELMESENAANAAAEAEHSERWRQYSEAADRYEAEQQEAEQKHNTESGEDLNNA